MRITYLTTNNFQENAARFSDQDLILSMSAAVDAMNDLRAGLTTNNAKLWKSWIDHRPYYKALLHYIRSLHRQWRYRIKLNQEIFDGVLRRVGVSGKTHPSMVRFLEAVAGIQFIGPTRLVWPEDVLASMRADLLKKNRAHYHLRFQAGPMDALLPLMVSAPDPIQDDGPRRTQL